MPNGEIITSTHTALLPQHNLPHNARKAHIFPGLKKPLVSIGTLCDNKCVAVFDAQRVTIYNQTNRQIIMQGNRDATTGLYMIDMVMNQLKQQPQVKCTEMSRSDDLKEDNKVNNTVKIFDNQATLPSLTSQEVVAMDSSLNDDLFQANHVYETKSKQELVSFYHAACFSPSKSTFIAAIKRNAFISWPGLTANLVSKYLPKTEATIKGHIRQKYKGTQSTQPTKLIKQEVPEIISKRTNQLFLNVTEFSNKIYTDQTGRFPVTSSRGYKYIMVAYDYDSNNIIAEPVKSRTGVHIKEAYHNIRQLLCNRGLQPSMHVLDNECSKILKDYMAKENENYQLVPPHLHRRNAAERAIQTFKNHFIAGIVSTHNDFPLHLWCRLLPQAILTLNLLRPSRINPKLSAHAQLHGQFDFNATPLAPPGTKVIVHLKPSVRLSWEPRGKNGWYINRAKDHYRCYDVYLPETRAVIQSDTVEFFPHNSKMPFRSSTENATIAATELIHALRNPSPAAPYAHIGDAQIAALTTLAEIFQRATLQPHHQQQSPSIITPQQVPTE